MLTATTSRAPRRFLAMLASGLALAIGLAGLSAVTTLESAAAAASNPLAPLKKFTVLVQGNATVGNSGEFEGSLAAGGNLIFQQYNLNANKDGSGLPSVDGLSNVQLFLGGTLQFPGSGKFDVNAGLSRITDTTGMSISPDNRLYKASTNSYLKTQSNQQVTVAGSGPTSYTATPGAFASEFPASTFATLQSTSATLAGLSAGTSVAMVTADSGSPERTITLTSGKVNVWNVSASTLAGLTAVNFAGGVKPSATTPLILNVSNDAGGTVKSVRLNTNDVALSKYILWNFNGWSTVTVTSNGAFYGAILAPTAALSYENNSEFNGQIAAKSFAITTGAEIHHYGFSYDVPEKTVVAGSWSTTGECDSPSNQLIVHAVTGVTYTWTKGKSGTFQSFSQSGLEGTYAFTVSVTDAASYTLGSNPASFEVTFEDPAHCDDPPVECIPPKLVTYTYEPGTNSGTITVPSGVKGYSDTLCKPFWVSAVAWTYTKNATWPQQLAHDNPMSNNEGGFTITKSGVYSYGAPVECGQGDIYASFKDQKTTSPTLSGFDHLNGPSTPFPEFFLHGMGFTGPTPTWVQSPLGCNKVTPEPVTPQVIPAQACDVDGSLTVGSGDATAVLTSAAPVATVRGVVYTLTKGTGVSGAWEVTATPATNKFFGGTDQKVTYTGDLGVRLTCATPAEPTLTAAECDVDSGVVTDAFAIIPKSDRFTYRHNGVVLAEGDKVTLPANATTAITVEAKPGFKNVGKTEFTFSPADIDCDEPVEYVAPTVIDEVCLAATGVVTGASLTFSLTPHVTYFVDGAEVVFAAGESSAVVAVTPGTRVVTATTEAGYFLKGTANLTTKDYDVVVQKAATCDKPVEFVAPKVSPEVCDAVNGGSKDGSVTFETIPANLTYVFNGRTVVEGDSFSLAEGDYQLVVTAAKGFFITGADAEETYTIKVGPPSADCDEAVEYVAPKVSPEVCDAVNGGSKDGSVTFETIPANLTYVFNGRTVVEGDSFSLAEGDYQLVVTAAKGFFITGADAEETYTIKVGPPSADCDELITLPVDPFASPEECVADPVTGEGLTVDGSITIVYAANVTWEISNDADGVRKPVTVTSPNAKFAYPAGDYHVWATAASGYILSGPTSFPVKVGKPALRCDLDTFAELPTSASWVSQTCTPSGLVGPSITVVPEPGVTYFIDGKAVTSATTNLEPGTYTLTAAADSPTNTVSQATWPPIVLTAAATTLCGDLTTLALTGATPGGFVILAIVLLQAGLVLVAVRYARTRKARHLAI